MKERIDLLLVERRLVESRTKAQWLIKQGFVLVEGKKILKPSKRIDNILSIQLIKKFPYVGRGGLKLEVALKEFSIDATGKICADVGASVGGFTDCLLKHGARKIYAIDKAFDILHPSLRCEKVNKCIIPVLGVDARNLIKLDEKVDICTIDLTFTSLKVVIPNIKSILKAEGDIIALVKPIFEIEFESNRKFKIIKDPQQLYQILMGLFDWCSKNQFFIYNIIKSPLLGKEGAIEFFIHIRVKESNEKIDFKKIVTEIII
ncbi:MAG: 16S/23S rRNA (cytidine-2'-O)-methyltransferase TlyA [Candidatus Lokiarchaeum sp. GC14_75]|nr:MAG: 16S/23S rRNA (cytidine-2'-O)-methyltransferase TlyA [Candidatus Lokiarchaeum sp. GC14_75]